MKNLATLYKGLAFVFLTVVFYVGVLGLGVPFLISAKDDFAVILGLAVFVFTIPLYWVLPKAAYNALKTYATSKATEETSK